MGNIAPETQVNTTALIILYSKGLEKKVGFMWTYRMATQYNLRVPSRV